MFAMHDGKKQNKNIPSKILEMRLFWSAVSLLEASKDLSKICEIIYRTVILL